MKRILSLLLSLLAAFAFARAEEPAFTEGELQALEILALSLEKDAERQIAPTAK